MRSSLRSVLVCSILAVLFSVFSTPTAPAATRSATENTASAFQFLDEPVFGSRVFLAEAGPRNGPSVVLVHGLGDDGAHIWDSLVAALAAKYHVVTFDLPGFGRSSKPDAAYSPAKYADFVEWVAARFVSGRFSLVAHSLGGAVAIRYAAKHPERLDRLVLADVAGVLHRMALTKEMVTSTLAGRGTSAATLPLGYVDSLVKSALARMPSIPVDLQTVVDTPYLRKTLLSGSPARVAALALAEDDLAQAVYSVVTPTLVLWGSKDTVASIRTASLLAGSLPRARLRLFEGAGHEPMRDQLGSFNTAVMEWLEGKEVALAPKRALPTTARVGRCDGERGAVFTGDYRAIEVTSCKDVKISGATAREVTITDSSVDIRDCLIRGEGTGLVIRDSTVVLTAVRIEGAQAIQASSSRLDLAGVQLVGTGAAISTRDRSSLLFSVCRADSPHTHGFLHGSLDLTPEDPL